MYAVHLKYFLSFRNKIKIHNRNIYIINILLYNMDNTRPQSPTYEIDGNDLVLYRDTRLTEHLVIKGNIFSENGRHSLVVNGNIKAKNINVYDIDANNINAGNITARNINAFDIDAFDINAHNIDAFNIDANNIKVLCYLDAISIDAGDIKAYSISCEHRIKRTLNARTVTKI